MSSPQSCSRLLRPPHILQLPAPSQGPWQCDAIRRAEGQERRNPTTQEGGTCSDIRTAETAQKGPQGAYETFIRPLISRVPKCAVFAGCQHLACCSRIFCHRASKSSEGTPFSDTLTRDPPLSDTRAAPLSDTRDPLPSPPLPERRGINI